MTVSQNDELEQGDVGLDSNIARKGFLGWISMVGVGALAAAATVFQRPPRALADDICNWYACCCLKFPAGGCGSGTNLSCTGGTTKRQWTCCTSTYAYLCAECTTGSTCFDPEWTCSGYQRLSYGC